MLLPFAGSIAAADARLAPRVTRALLEEVAAAVPEAWLDGDDRRVYVDYLCARLESPRSVRRRRRSGRGR